MVVALLGAGGRHFDELSDAEVAAMEAAVQRAITTEAGHAHRRPRHSRMSAPKPKQIYDDPDAYWDFVTVAADTAFEGQHFDRKEAGRAEADGTTHNAKLRNVRDQIEECVSAFANATGGLLVLGISNTGAVMGLKHLNEEQLNGLLKFERLVHHGCQVRLHDVVNAQAVPDRVALFLVPPGDGPICETVQVPAKAWIRQGLQNVPLSDAARDRLKRDTPRGGF